MLDGQRPGKRGGETCCENTCVLSKVNAVTRKSLVISKEHDLSNREKPSPRVTHGLCGENLVSECGLSISRINIHTFTRTRFYVIFRRIYGELCFKFS